MEQLKNKGGNTIETIEKIGIAVVVIMLLTASSLVYLSWNQQPKDACPITVLNVTSNVTTMQSATSQPTPKPQLVYLYMTNCPYCEQMKPIVSNLVANGYDVVQYNIDSQPEMAVKYNVDTTPTLVVLQNGTETARFGVTDESTLINALK